MREVVSTAQSTIELSQTIHGFANNTLAVSDKFFFQTDFVRLALHIKRPENSTASNKFASITRN
jgi:hypothetical protein